MQLREPIYRVSLIIATCGLLVAFAAGILYSFRTVGRPPSIEPDYVVYINHLLGKAEAAGKDSPEHSENFRRALSQMRIAAKIDMKRRKLVLLQLAEAAESIGEPEVRIDALRELAARNELDSAKQYNDLAMTLLETQRGMRQADPDVVHEAERYARKAIEMDPNFAPAYCNLGGAMMLAGDARVAAECFEAALRLDPTMLAAQQALEYLRAQGVYRSHVLK